MWIRKPEVFLRDKIVRNWGLEESKALSGGSVGGSSCCVDTGTGVRRPSTQAGHGCASAQL